MHVPMTDNTICENACYGCSACAMICPVGAISMVENEKGFLIPLIEEKKCIRCNKCIASCRQKIDYHKQNQSYIAKLKDSKSQSMSQSGGAFVAISNVVLKQGGVVYGVALNDRFEAEHIRATTYEERDKMRGSKYIQSNIKAVYHCVEKDLDDKIVLFSGTPCQVSGLNKYLNSKKKSTKNLYTIDLICHGVPSVKIWRDLIKFYEEREQSKIEKVVFRDKTRGGWGEHFSSFYTQKNQICDSYHRKLFYSNLALRDSCYVCEFAKSERVSDFTIGDAWGVKKNNPEFFDDKGVSLILLHTEKAVNLFEYVKDELHCQLVPFEEYKQGNMKHPSSPHRSVQEFWTDYEKKGFNFIIKKYAQNNIILNRRYILKLLKNKLKKRG